jgi:hypothetical protein
MYSKLPGMMFLLAMRVDPAIPLLFLLLSLVLQQSGCWF